MSIGSNLITIKGIFNTLITEYKKYFGKNNYDVVYCYNQLFNNIWFPNNKEIPVSLLSNTNEIINDICIFMDSISVGYSTYPFNSLNSTDIKNITNDTISPIGCIYTMKYKSFSRLSYWNPLRVDTVVDDVIQTDEQRLLYTQELYNTQMNAFWNWNNGVFRLCRGLVLGITDLNEYGTVKPIISNISIPYTKFFNVGEFNEVSYELFEQVVNDKDSYIEVVDKLDGTMITASYVEDWNDVIVCSMGSANTDSPYIKRAYEYIKPLLNTIRVNPSYTFIFELISEESVNVVIYNKIHYGLTLIGVINKGTGLPCSYKQIKKLFPNIPTPDFYKGDALSVFKELMNYEATEKEGWIVNVNGNRFKIKTTDYIQTHKVIQYYRFPQKFLQSCFDGTLLNTEKQHPKLYELHYKEKHDLYIRRKFYIMDTITSLFKLILKETNLTFYDGMNIKPDELTTFITFLNNTPDSCSYLRTFIKLFKPYLINVFKTGQFNFIYKVYGDVIKYIEPKEFDHLYSMAVSCNNLITT